MIYKQIITLTLTGRIAAPAHFAAKYFFNSLDYIFSNLLKAKSLSFTFFMYFSLTSIPDSKIYLFYITA